MKKLIVMVSLLAFAVSVNAATKAELKARLEATGDYFEVGEPIKLRPIKGEGGLNATQYYIAVMEKRSDSLVFKERTFYLRVIDDSMPTERALFRGFDPTVTPSVPAEDFLATIKERMVSAGVQGTIIATDTVGNARWAIVERYQNGTDPAKDFTKTLWKITRTDGVTWSVQKLEP